MDTGAAEQGAARPRGTVVVIAEFRARQPTVSREPARGPIGPPRRPLSAAAIAHRERMLKFLAGRSVAD